MLKIYTPNPGFSGVRNAGRLKAEFKNGVAEVNEEAAKFFCERFGYLSPALFPEHTEKVEKIRGKIEIETPAIPEVPGECESLGDMEDAPVIPEKKKGKGKK